MLVLLIQWLCISIIALVYGKMTLAIIERLSKVFISTPVPQIFIFLTGLASINFLGNLWSLAFAVGPSFLLVLSLTVFIYLIKERFSSLKPKGLNLIILLPLVLIALLLALHPTSNADEAGYYLPLVKWIEAFPVVKGTALFIARLGFNSALHMLSAIFGISTLSEGGVYELNGLLFIWFNYYFFQAAIRIFKGNSICLYSDTLLTAALIFPFSFLIDAMDSDYLVTMGSIILIAQLLQVFINKEKIGFSLIALFLIITALLIQTKPFAGLLLIGPCLLLHRRAHSLKSKILGSLLLLLILSPWLVRNVIISGYLVFPAYYLDLFEVEWKMPLEMARASLDIIKEHAKVQIIRHDYKLVGIKEMNLDQWLPTWIAFQKEQMIGWFFLILTPISILLALASSIAAFLKKDKQVELALLGFSFIVLLFWFFNFPAIRFGWSWIISFIVISVLLSLQLFLPRLQRASLMILLLLVGLSWLRLGYNTVRNSEQINVHFISPPKVQIDIVHSILSADKVEIKVSNDPYCHGAAPPCQPYNNPYTLVPIGKNILEGFKVEKKE